MDSEAKKQNAEHGMKEASMEPEAKRIRAWVLMNAVAPAQAGEALGGRFADGRDAYIIIRADEVHSETGSIARDVNLIIPVDVAGETELTQVLKIIDETPGVGERTVARVVGYHPTPPHKSHLFVTEDERTKGPPGEYPRAGRHPQSPGRNGWG